MALHIVAAVVFVALLGYIIFLHIRLTKKNIFIESTVRRLSGIEKSRSMEEMMLFLQEIYKSGQYNSHFSHRLLDKSSIEFILENYKEIRTYSHYTKDEADAKSILRDGFRFADSFYKTALPITKDKLDMIIKHNNRKYFGENLIIISISTDIVNFYSMELEKAGIKNYSFENVLTITPPSKNDNSDHMYQLAPQFVKGYINVRTGVIAKNPGFDPWYNSPAFMKNVELLKTHE
jgi:hypothetical protein